jgi:hypothetical protein
MQTRNISPGKAGSLVILDFLVNPEAFATI